MYENSEIKRILMMYEESEIRAPDAELFCALKSVVQRLEQGRFEKIWPEIEPLPWEYETRCQAYTALTQAVSSQWTLNLHERGGKAFPPLPEGVLEFPVDYSDLCGRLATIALSYLQVTDLPLH